jgi:hypothetical protein
MIVLWNSEKLGFSHADQQDLHANQPETHTLKRFQATLETPKIFIIPFIINLQTHFLD